jgi:O-antigen/teichoic acid export membrane protein
VIRATFISAVDQALLSALSLGLAVLLIHFASKQDYGLYSQLINLQSLLSPLHAGVFVSAYLALASKMDASQQAVYRGAMARAEVAVTIASTVLVAAIGMAVGRFISADITPNLCIAFALALLGLWWREFVRQTRFVNSRYEQALNIDATYCVATTAAIGVLVVYRVSAESVFWCMAFGALIAVAAPLFSLVREIPVGISTIRREVALSWNLGRWDVVGSFVTWGYAQSYIYFAALHGGLNGAAEIAASRLLGSPLALMWAAYSNVLRPNASRLLADGSPAEVRRVARQYIWLVLALSAAYGLVIFQLIPILEPTLFGGKFPMLRRLSMWWIAYFTLTGISTVAMGILRSALQFRRLFHLQVLSCIAAVALLTASLASPNDASLVIAMILGEAVSAVLFWRSTVAAIAQCTR